MRNNNQDQIHKKLSAKETEELLDIWQYGDIEEWGEKVFDIVKEILLARLGYLPPQSTETKVSQVLDKVEEHIENNELDKALIECESAIHLNPNDAIAYNYLGVIYDGMGQLENALVNFLKAVQLDPDFRDAWKNMLIVEAEIKKEFEESTEKQRLDSALDYAYIDEIEKALEECELARVSLPNVAIAYNYLGLILQTLDQLEPAIDAYLKAIELNPRFYAARENLANARVLWEEEQYHSFSNLNRVDANNSVIEFDESQILDSGGPIPQWLYLDKADFFLIGWPGHRNRQGRSGYDPLESDFEFAHMQGVMIRLLLTSKFRTRNPFYLFFMTFVGFIYFLSGILPFALGSTDDLIFGIIQSPYLVVGILLLVNVCLSLRFVQTDEHEDTGNEIF